MKRLLLALLLSSGSLLVLGQSLPPISADFKIADSIALAKYKKKYKKDVGKLTAYLTQSLDTDIEKARVIYRWITNNLALETEDVEEKEHNSVAFIKAKAGTSYNFAMLFEEMCDSAGLDVVTILGYSKGVTGYELGDDFLTITSAWNAISLDNQWYLIHPSRGTGYLARQDFKTLDYEFKRKFNPDYFLADPVKFSMTDLAALPKWQLLHCPVSMDLFQGNPVKMATFHLEHNDVKKDTCFHYTDSIALDDGQFILDPFAVHEFNPKNIHIQALFSHKASEVFLQPYLPVKSNEELKSSTEGQLEDRKKQSAFLLETLDSTISYYKQYLRLETQQYRDWLSGSKERSAKLKIEHNILAKDNKKEVSTATRLATKLEGQQEKYQESMNGIQKIIDKEISKESLAGIPTNPRENNDTRLGMIEKNRNRIKIGLDSVGAYKSRMLVQEERIKKIFDQINDNLELIINNAKLKKEKLELKSKLERGETGLSHQLLHIYEIKEANVENDSLRKTNIQLSIVANREKVEFNKLFTMAKGKLKFAQNLLKANKKLDHNGAKHDDEYQEVVNTKKELFKLELNYFKMLVDLNAKEIQILNEESQSLAQEAEMHLASIEVETTEFTLISEKKKERLDKLKLDIDKIVAQHAETLKALRKEKIQLDRL